MRQWAFVFVLLMAVLAARHAPAPELAHAIFVKVNGKTITQEQVVEAVKFIIKREFNDVMPEDEEELDKIQRAALRDLVRTLLIHDEAARSGIKPNRNSWKEWARRHGLTQDDVTPTIRRMLEADDLFEEMMMASGTPINQPSPREVKDFYNKNRDEFKTNAFVIVRTIFLSTDSTPSRPQSYYKAMAEDLMTQLDNVPVAQRTEAFAKAAREKSQDIFAKTGGLLTGDSPEKWIPKDFNNENEDGSPIFPPTMVEEIRRLNRKGEVRLAVSSDGMHLLYCEDVQGGKVIGWDEASRIIEYVLKERTKNSRMRGWLNRVYDRSDVRWHDGTMFNKETLTEILLPSEKGAMED